jgi:hypothetical protein
MHPRTGMQGQGRGRRARNEDAVPVQGSGRARPCIPVQGLASTVRGPASMAQKPASNLKFGAITPWPKCIHIRVHLVTRVSQAVNTLICHLLNMIQWKSSCHMKLPLGRVRQGSQTFVKVGFHVTRTTPGGLLYERTLFSILHTQWLTIRSARIREMMSMVTLSSVCTLTKRDCPYCLYRLKCIW